jgi:hypothetical protein
MKAECVPQIRLEVDGMKASITQALGLRGSELEKHLGNAVDEALAAYPWNEVVGKIVDDCLNAAIDFELRHGRVGTAIREAVTQSFVISEVTE